MKTEQVDAILTGDWHLRETKPKCRTDDYWKAQEKKVNQITALSYEFGCPIIHSGDLFHHWKPSPYLLNWVVVRLKPYDFQTIIGNHDLPQHNLELIDKSGIQVLIKTNTIKLINGVHWGMDLEPVINIDSKNMTVVHTMVWKGKEPWPGCTDPEINELFDIFPNHDLILTGHNHKPIVAKKGKRLIVNPGSIMRMTADQIKHRPRVYLWNAVKNTVKPFYLDTEDDVINRDHIDKIKDREKRTSNFLKKLKINYKHSLSFEANIETALQKTKIHKDTKQLIYELMED